MYATTRDGRMVGEDRWSDGGKEKEEEELVFFLFTLPWFTHLYSTVYNSPLLHPLISHALVWSTPGNSDTAKPIRWSSYNPFTLYCLFYVHLNYRATWERRWFTQNKLLHFDTPIVSDLQKQRWASQTINNYWPFYSGVLFPNPITMF